MLYFCRTKLKGRTDWEAIMTGHASRSLAVQEAVKVAQEFGPELTTCEVWTVDPISETVNIQEGFIPLTGNSLVRKAVRSGAASENLNVYVLSPGGHCHPIRQAVRNADCLLLEVGEPIRG
jgi:hypothetical protein